jgi:hypothetical protein
VCKRKRRLVQLALELHGNDYQQHSVEMKNRDTVEITPRALCIFNMLGIPQQYLPRGLWLVLLALECSVLYRRLYNVRSNIPIVVIYKIHEEINAHLIRCRGESPNRQLKLKLDRNRVLFRCRQADRYLSGRQPDQPLEDVYVTEREVGLVISYAGASTEPIYSAILASIHQS